MGKNMLAVLALWVVCAVAAVPPLSDTIIKMSYPHPACLPATLPELVEVACYLNRTVLMGSVSYMCNCSADRSTIHRWTYVGGVYTSVGNFSSHVCTPGGIMYTSVYGLCGGESYDSYMAHLLEGQLATTQHGNAHVGAGLFGCILGLFGFMCAVWGLFIGSVI